MDDIDHDAIYDQLHGNKPSVAQKAAQTDDEAIYDQLHSGDAPEVSELVVTGHRLNKPYEGEDLSIPAVAGGFIKNIIPGLWHTGHQLVDTAYQAVGSPGYKEFHDGKDDPNAFLPEKAIVNVGGGVAQHLVNAATGGKGPKFADTATADALGQQYKDEYGGGRNILNTLKNNPAAPVVDIASLLLPALKGAKVAEIAEGAANASKATEAAAAASAASKPGVLASLVPTSVKAGFEGGEANKAFTGAMRNGGKSPVSPTAAAEAASAASDDAARIPVAPIRDAYKGIKSQHFEGKANVTGVSPTVVSTADNIVKDIAKTPGLQTPTRMGQISDRLGTMAEATSGPDADYLNSVKKSIDDAINIHAPTYSSTKTNLLKFGDAGAEAANVFPHNWRQSLGELGFTALGGLSGGSHGFIPGAISAAGGAVVGSPRVLGEAGNMLGTLGRYGAKGAEAAYSNALKHAYDAAAPYAAGTNLGLNVGRDTGYAETNKKSYNSEITLKDFVARNPDVFISKDQIEGAVGPPK